MNITVSCHGVKGPMTTGRYCTIFPFCGGGKKKRPKNKGILWLGYHRYPSNYKRYERFVSVKWVFLQFSTSSPNNSLPFYGKLLRQSKVTLCPKKLSFKCFEIFPLSELVSTYDKLYIYAKKISWCRHFKLQFVRMSNNNLICLKTSSKKTRRLRTVWFWVCVIFPSLAASSWRLNFANLFDNGYLGTH